MVHYTHNHWSIIIYMLGVLCVIMCSGKCVFISEPSSPPVDMQLSALDSSSVLVSWRPPLEPNGIILIYWILYTGNISHPEHLWINATHQGRTTNTNKHVLLHVYNESLSLSLSVSFFSGSVTSAEVQGLKSGTRYYFKMGASTEIGVGPFSPVRDVYTPTKKYGVCICV